VAHIVARYTVASYAEWRRMVDEHAATLPWHGVTRLEVFCSAHDPTDVLLIFEGDDVEQLRRTWDSGQLRQWRHEGGTLAEVLYLPAP
jgi:hypothetical protein